MQCLIEKRNSYFAFSDYDAIKLDKLGGIAVDGRSRNNGAAFARRRFDHVDDRRVPKLFWPLFARRKRQH